MVFYIVRYDGDRLNNDLNKNLIETFIAREASKHPEPLFYSIAELSEYIKLLFPGGMEVNARYQNDYDLFKTSIYENNTADPDQDFYTFASIEEIDKFLREELQKTLTTRDFDILKLTTKGGELFGFEEIELFQSSLDQSKSLGENLQSLLRSNLYSELCNEQNSKIVEEIVNLGEITSLKNRTEKVVIDLQSLGTNQENKKNNHFIEKKVFEIVESLKITSNAVSTVSGNLQDIMSHLQIEVNSSPDRISDLIKYPSVFSPDNLHIEHLQSDDNKSNIFVVTNNTTYYWYNISIVLIQNNNNSNEKDNNYGNRIAEIPLIEPRADKKECTSPYNYDLIGKLGYFIVQAFYHNQVISNSISISRINIVNITTKKQGALIKLKNNYIEIDITIDYTRNGASKSVKMKLGNFEIKDQLLMGVCAGDSLDVKISSQKDKILLCPDTHLNVS